MTINRSLKFQRYKGAVDMDQEKKIKRLVIKVGTSTLTHAGGKLNVRRIEQLVSAMVDIHNQDVECVLVSSGAIGIGRSRLNRKRYTHSLSEKQALAAIGQGLLMHIYEKKFSEYGTMVAQVLLVKDDMSNRTRFLNARNTISELLGFGIIPIINENDTVSIDEIRFGDNDTLAALVAVLIDADMVILLTDIDGFYTDNPKENPNAERLSVICDITDEIEEMAGTAGSDVGTGGMKTKVEAAKIATSAGIPLVIASGDDPYVIHDILNGRSVGTMFSTFACHLPSRKSWIVYGSAACGSITIDDGAVRALVERGKSLLPSGIISVVGAFEKGDVVDITDQSGKVVAKGITNYAAEDVEKIKGMHTSQLSKVINGGIYDVVIHRDNMGLVH